MFVLLDTSHRSLQLSYEGPYRVLKRADRHYILDVTGRLEVVSLNHLKTEYLKSDLFTINDLPTQATSTVPPTELPITIINSGRLVRKHVLFS